MNKELMNAMSELESLKQELREFSETAEKAIRPVHIQWSNLDDLYNKVYKKYWCKLFLWDDPKERDRFNDGNKFIIKDYFTDEAKEVKYSMKKYPVDFKKSRKWDKRKIKKAFEDIRFAQINRSQLIHTLEEAIIDIKNFEKELKKNIEKAEQKILNIYNEKIINNKKVEKQELLKAFFQDETVKEIIVEELLGLEIKKE